MEWICGNPATVGYDTTASPERQSITGVWDRDPGQGVA